MKQLTEIAMELNMLADEVEGNHLTNKETAATLREISNEVYGTSFKIRKLIEPITETTGISDKGYKLMLMHENIKELENEQN